MNKWIRRAVGTVGIAGGALLLGAGTAHADDSVTAAEDPQLLHGLIEHLFSPTGGAGMSLDTPGHRTTTGLMPGGPLRTSANDGDTGVVVHAPDRNGQPRDVFAGGRMPDLFRALPITDAIPSSGLGLTPQPAEGLPFGDGGLPVDNVPLDLPQGLSSNGLGLPIDGLPFSGGPAMGGGLPVGGGSLPVGGSGGVPTSALPVGSDLPVGASDLAGGNGEVRDLTGAARTVVLGDAVHVLPPAEALPLGSGLPSADGLPILGTMLADTALPLHGNLDTLPNTPAIPLDQPFGSGASGSSEPSTASAERPVVGESESTTGSPGGLPLGGLPLGGLPLGGLPLGGLPLGGLPLGGLPLGGLPVGGIPLGALPLGSLPLTGGAGGLPVAGGGLPLAGHGATSPAGMVYNPRHAAAERPVAGESLPAEQLPGANMLPIVDGMLSSTPAGDLPIFSTLMKHGTSQSGSPATGAPAAANPLPVQPASATQSLPGVGGLFGQ
jgi:hypothetical protein